MAKKKPDQETSVNTLEPLKSENQGLQPGRFNEVQLSPSGQEVAPSAPMMMLQMAVEKGADMAQIEKFMDLVERHEKNEARKAYTLAMANFKANAPELVKDSKASFDHQNGGGKTEYGWASLAQIASKVAAVMGNFGLSHHWDIDQSEQASIKVTCIITHAMGHSERISMSAGPETSGKKNPIQQIASAIKYMERYTLLAACGLDARDEADDDAAQAGNLKEDSFYSESEFKANFPKWEKLIKNGDKKHSDLISFITRKTNLTASQIEEINAIKKG